VSITIIGHIMPYMVDLALSAQLSETWNNDVAVLVNPETGESCVAVTFAKTETPDVKMTSLVDVDSTKEGSLSALEGTFPFCTGRRFPLNPERASPWTT